MFVVQFIVVLSLWNQVSTSAIPIWELLSQQEKMGQLMYNFIHLVELYCKDSPIPDCQKMLTLYGMSNLMNKNEDTLNRLDPYHKNSRDILWKTVLTGDFELPEKVGAVANKPSPPPFELEKERTGINGIEDYSFNDYYDYHDTAVNDPHPYAVRVPPPAKYLEKVLKEKEEEPKRNQSPIDNMESTFSDATETGKHLDSGLHKRFLQNTSGGVSSKPSSEITHSRFGHMETPVNSRTPKVELKTGNSKIYYIVPFSEQKQQDKLPFIVLRK